MKTSELEGAELDYWVAKAVDRLDPRINNGKCITQGGWGFYPSINWGFGGPLIGEYEISLDRPAHGNGDWNAIIRHCGGESWQEMGPTPLIAAMRCLVASKFGESVG